MARVYSHRRNRSGNQLKAKPMEAIYGAVVSGISIVLYAAIVVVSVDMAGETPNWIGGLGFLGICTAIGAFIYVIKQMKTKTDFVLRLICMGVSTVSLLIWFITFLIGMFR